MSESPRNQLIVSPVGSLREGLQQQTPFSTEELNDAAKKSTGAWSKNTKRAYASSWEDFERWCARRGRNSLPADVETVTIYLGWAAEHGADGDLPLGLASVEMRASAIGWRHRVAGLQNPTASDVVRLRLKAIRNEKGRAPKRRVDPVVNDVLEKLLDTIDRGFAKGKLHAAVLLVGRDGAFRRSEVTGLDMEHLRPLENNAGYAINLAKSKTDQTGKGFVTALPRVGGKLCPVEALESWLHVRGTAPGPVFRSVSNGGAVLPNRLPARTVARIVQLAVRRAGLKLDVAGHSLRAGFVTQAVFSGADVTEIQAQTHHTDLKSLLGYVRREDPLAANAVMKLKGK